MNTTKTTNNVIHVPSYMWTMRRGQEAAAQEGWHHETLHLPDSDLGGLEFKSREQLEEEIHHLREVVEANKECERMMAEEIQHLNLTVGMIGVGKDLLKEQVDELQNEVNKLRIEKNKQARKELEAKQDK